MRIGHLSKRFFGSLRPGGPAADDVTWARSHMLPGEREIWQQMSRADRRHSVARGPARRAFARARGEPSRARRRAARTTAGRSTPASAPTAEWSRRCPVSIAGQSAAEEWTEARGFTRKIGLYVRHAQIGADRLALGGQRSTHDRVGSGAPPTRGDVDDPTPPRGGAQRRRRRLTTADFLVRS